MMDTIYYIDNHGNSIEATRAPNGSFWCARFTNRTWRACWFAKTASQAIVKACSFTGG